MAAQQWPYTRAGMEVDYQVVDMTGGISGTGVHSWDPASVSVINEPEQVVIVGQTDPAYHIVWDFADGAQFRVANVSDGTDTTSGTNAGKVRVRIEGLR